MDALIISDNKAAFIALAQIVRSTGDHAVVHASSGREARITGMNRQFDIVVVSSVVDDNIKTLATHFADKKEGGVILIEAAAHSEEVSQTLEKYGVIVVEKPISKIMMRFAVKTVIASNYRVKSYIDKTNTLLKKIDEIKLVNRAKLLLMQRLSYSEEKAHRHIEKTAMDMRLARRAVAMNIIKMYDD